MIRIYNENVEWIFNQDVRDKKKTGNGIHGRAARLRKKESVKMPSEREPNKFQRRLILGAGPCYVTSLREMKLLEWLDKIQNGEWISIEELKSLPFEDGQKIYAELRRLYTTADMYKGFTCSSAQIAELSWHFQVARSGKTIVVGEPALDVLRNFSEHRNNQTEKKRQQQENDGNKPQEANNTGKRKYKQREKKNPQKDPITNTQKETDIDKMYQEEIPPGQLTLVEIKKPEIELLRISLKNIYSSEQVIALFTRLKLFVEGQENKFEISLTLQEKQSE